MNSKLVPKVSIIIPNWNGRDLLPTCLSSLKDQTYTDFEIILVDNGSTDDSINVARTLFPKIKIIKLKKNKGFAAAINAGVQLSESELVAFLNNDTQVDPKWLSYLVSCLKNHPEIISVTSKLLNYYDRKIIDGAGDKVNIIGQPHQIGFGQKDNPKFNQEGLIFSTTGGASLFRRESFLSVGAFDEDFFAYFEDVDFGLRAQLAGFKFWYQPKAIVYHIHEATSRGIFKTAQYWRFRNTILLVLKNFPLQLFFKRGRWWKIPLVWIHTFFYFFQKSWGRQALKTFLWLIFHLPSILRKRRKIQKNIKISIEYLDSLMENKNLKIGPFRL